MKTSDSRQVGNSELDNGDDQQDEEGELLWPDGGEEDERAAQDFLTEAEDNIRFVSEVAENIAQLALLARIKLDMLTCDGLFEGLTLTLDRVRGVLDQAIAEIRTVLSQLSPPLLAELGLEYSLNHLCRQLEEQSGVRVLFGDDGQEKPLSGLARAIVYHAVRKTLFTVLHEEKNMQLRLSVARIGEWIQLVIEDLGGGYDYTETVAHLREPGRKTIWYCIRQLGGDVRLIALPDRRTGIRIRVPVTAKVGETLSGGRLLNAGD